MSKPYVLWAAVALSSSCALPATAIANALKQSAILRAAGVQPNTSGSQISDGLDTLFGTAGCPLPPKVLKRIQDKNEKGVIPEELHDRLGNDLSATATQVSDRTAMATLLQIQLPGQSNPIPLSSSELYESGNPVKYMLYSPGNVIYTLDCTGYLNAALSVDTGGLSDAEVKSSAKSALQSSVAITVVRATLDSPAAIAMDPGLSPTQLDAATRIDLLYTIEKEAQNTLSTIQDNTFVTTWRELRMVWMSNQGSSSFQGAANITASGGASFLVGSVQSNVSAGGFVSRNISFANFTTYVLNEVAPTPVQRKYGELRSELMDAIRHAKASNVHQSDNGTTYTAYATFKDIPTKLCNRNWDASTNGNASPDISVTASMDSEGCEITMQANVHFTPHTVVALTSQSDLNPSETFKLAFQI